MHQRDQRGGEQCDDDSGMHGQRSGTEKLVWDGIIARREVLAVSSPRRIFALPDAKWRVLQFCEFPVRLGFPAISIS
jgi:hypothetical protein